MTLKQLTFDGNNGYTPQMAQGNILFLHMDLEKAHNFCMKHRDNVETSLCGCFYCGANFMGSSIKEWIDDGQTALCPICGIDSVISVRDVPKIQNHGYKQAMYNRWFDADTLAKIIVQKQEKELK